LDSGRRAWSAVARKDTSCVPSGCARRGEERHARGRGVSARWGGACVCVRASGPLRRERRASLCLRRCGGRGPAPRRATSGSPRSWPTQARCTAAQTPWQLRTRARHRCVRQCPRRRRGV
jgi:hypothetical protein